MTTLTRAAFEHAGQPYRVCFERYTVEDHSKPKVGGKWQRKVMMSWSLRTLDHRGDEGMCASGHWAPNLGCFSIDRMVPDEPSEELLALAMSFRDQGERWKIEGHCDGCVTAHGSTPAKVCWICRQVRANNKRVAREIEARAKRLLEPEEMEA